MKNYLINNEILDKKTLQKKCMPPVRFELTTPGLRDQCSTTELKRRAVKLNKTNALKHK